MGKIYVCPFCKEKFDTDKVEWEKYGSRRYAHSKCVRKHEEEERQKEERKKNRANAPKKRPKNIKICKYCHGDVDISAGDSKTYQKVGNRYAHLECYEKYYTSDEEFKTKIYQYLKSIRFDYDYVQCDRQRENFVKTLGYTNEEIYYTLKYMYDIKKLSPSRSEGRIGLVPYLKEEAMKYFNSLSLLQEKNLLAAREIINKKPIEVVMKAPKKPRDKGYIDLDSIGDD